MSILASKQSRLEMYKQAEAACLKNQSYTIKDRTYTRADLAVIARTIKSLENDIAQLQNGGMRVSRIVPRD